MPPAIAVSHLSKSYRVSHAAPRPDTFTDLFTDFIRRPFRARPSATVDETFWALRDVTFDVQRGEVVGIIGRNGAGKSTLLKILSRITAPTAGRVEIRGRVASLLEVGTGFHPELTGRENVYMNGSILGMSRAEIDRKFDQIVDFAGVERFLDTPLKRYSSGMHVRLAFAVAAHLEPEVMIVDEVLAVGDAAFQQKCLNAMGAVSKQGRTVFFVSHNMSAITKLCTRGLWIDAGTLRFESAAVAAVNAYLATNTEDSGSVWSGLAGDAEIAAVRSVQVFVDGAPGNTASFASGFEILVSYDVAQPLSDFTVAVQVWDSRGDCTFSSWDSDDPRSHGRCLSAGTWTSRCRIPGSLLRPGRYSVTVAAFQTHGDLVPVSLNGVVSLLVTTSGFSFNENRFGAVTPSLAWTIEENSGRKD